MIQRIREFTDSANFSRAVILTVAAVSPVLLFNYLGAFETGLAIALGAFLAYPADIPSNLPHRAKGLLITVFIISGTTLFINLTHPIAWLFYPATLALCFFLSMLSVYGQRATMVAFSGLLAVTLGTGHIHTGTEIFIYTGMMFAGGLYYTLLSLIFNYLNPHRYTELLMADCLKLTAKYMKLRGDLWNADADRNAIISRQLELQVQINETHESLREILIRNRSNAGSSKRSRKMLMVFIALMEILELALATSFDHSTLHEKFGAHSKLLATYQNLAYNLASALKKIGKSLNNRTEYLPKHSLKADVAALEKAIAEYESQLGKDVTKDGVWLLMNMLHYGEKQAEKIYLIERTFSQKAPLKEIGGNRDRDLEKFLTPEDYPLSTLRENLSLSSTIFRHSLRLTITIALGFIVGTIFPFQNVYWILLTIVVIMRPGYGLTKQRSYQRIIGTVAGGAIAFAFLSVVHQPVITGTLAIVCMLLGFAFTATNYSIGATFVTIYVLFLYSMLVPDVNQVIQYRFMDTGVGALLAFAGNYFFWPSWEFMNLPQYIKKSIEANRDYLAEISRFYNHKGEVTTGYRLSRKNAFIAIGNLMSSYQRMAQEPKSKQKQQQQVYKLAVLNHTLLSSVASLGTYIQGHKTYKASEAFNVVVHTVIRNLETAILLLNFDVQADEAQHSKNEDMALRFSELKNIRARELREIHLDNEDEFRLKMEEAHLVIEQLIWMHSLSERIIKAVKNLDAAK
ncbi:FUSC family membrane protein [Flavobacterium sp. RHBU_24]|uniref:FUSC family protein n=1 Tax=Flavobacterium sp. RHBU_24 TaxID=3391185 RepID=UPI003984AA0B